MDLKKVIISNLLLTAAYYLSGKLIGFLSLPPVGATPLWVPAGIAVAAVLIWGYRLLPGAFLGDLLIGLDIFGIGSLQAVSIAVVLGTQSMMVAFFARWLLLRYGIWPSSLVRERHIIKFFLLAAVVAPFPSALLTIGGQFLFGTLAASSTINAFLLWWMGTAMGIVIFTPVVLTLCAKPRAVWQARILTVTLPVMLLFVLLLVILTIARDKDNALNQTRFEANVSLMNSLIDNELTYQRSLLQSMSAYFRNSEQVTEQEFEHYLQDFSVHQHNIETVVWVEHISGDERDLFEQTTGSKVKQFDKTSGDWQTAAAGESFFVIKYAQSFANTGSNPASMKGVDLCSGGKYQLCRSLLGGGVSLIDMSQLMPYIKDADKKFIHLLPVTRIKDQKSGFVLYVVQYDQLFEQLYRSQSYTWVEFAVTNLSDGGLLYDSTSQQEQQRLYRPIVYKASRIISHANGQWRIDYYPSPLFLTTYSSWSFYWIVTAALFLFSFTGIWLMTMTGRYDLVEHEVTEKTNKLNKHAELLAVSEKKYRRLVENIQDEYFLYSHDYDGFFHYVSPSVESILGYSQDEFLSHYATYMPDTELNQKVEAYTQQTLSGKKSNYEVEIFSKDGKLHTLAVTEMPSYNESREIIGVEGIAHDITDIKASRLELEKLSLAVEHSPNAVIIMDKDGNIEYVNPKFTAITGYSKEEAMAKWPDLINSGINAPNIYQELWETVNAGREWCGELQNRKKNGDLYWAQELIAPMLNKAGQVTHFVATQVDITEARRLSEKTSYQATHDQLTGLINRQEFDLRLERVIQTAKHNQTEHALCFLDLDQFKVVNDTCGHIAGDELLRQIGALLLSNVRSRDTIARLGGDEFAILMEHCAIDQAFHACEQILQLLQDFRFHWQDYTFIIGGSIGLAIIDQFTQNSNDALRNVDTACYAAKDAGRNRVEVHREDSERLQQRRGEIHWSAEISEALDNDRFLLYAQPIKPLLNPDLNISYEILVRMQRRDGEISPPGAFLPAAERYNSITRIDRWVMTNTLRWITEHADKLNHIATISINLSGLTLGDESMLDFIIQQLNKTDIPAEKISFEITETAAIANLRAATNFIETLRRFGTRFALDDFGSGLSSFAYLKKLRVDSLKIDGMFVKDMLNDPLDFEMVKSINEIGHVMGLKTIAEFVEQEEILEKLREIGVDFVQGYAIGKPVPIDDILSNLM
ncbi:EAL domain-containing protein [Methylophaga sp. OBS4]|uniref:EAL domain-containing protein n=1 Tax=Methylophaga sp. OBS4 TaxID=2991935 RepID=UPI00224D62EF|nr:EAL domain-containing protein [Methylophaga sp. OBS4]MCX4187481.1 EAL domain-containing protein [Methylophaga sp. OBS4]